MLGDKEIDAAVNQLAAYRKDNTLTDILARYETLLGDYKRLKSDYEEEREARERWKQQARGQERNPFVLVLVDADGYVFDDDCRLNSPTLPYLRLPSLLTLVSSNRRRPRGRRPCCPTTQRHHQGQPEEEGAGALRDHGPRLCQRRRLVQSTRQG